MAENGTTPPPYGGPQSGFAGRGTRFFDWMRSLGVARTDGWIGGVCAGVAYRIGIDPLIVRGIVVVAALVGAPALLLYALAWALLPDRDGRIHLQRLFNGEFEPPIVAIGVLLVLSLLPWASGFWWIGGPFGHDPGWADIVGRVFWTLIVLGAATALIVIAVRNADRRGGTPGAPGAGSPLYGTPTAADTMGAQSVGVPSTGGASTTVDDAAGVDSSAASAAGAAGVSTSETAGRAQTASAPEASPSDASAASPSGSTPTGSTPTVTAASAASTATLPTVPAPTVDTAAEPTAPPAPTIGATEQDLADWRARQAQWKLDHAQWKQRLAEDMRAVKAQRSAEMRAQASAASAEADARRAAYRRSNPRVGAAVGWLAVGLALVAGALTSAFWGPLSGLPGYALTAALAAATLVFGLTVLIAGIARRRSGFLIFLGIMLAVFTGLAALVPTVPRVAIESGAVAGRPLDVTPEESANYLQGWGESTIDLSKAVTAPGIPVIDLAKSVGTTTILVPADSTVRVIAVTPTRLTVEGDLTESETVTIAESCTAVGYGACANAVLVGPSGAPDAVVRVLQVNDVVIERVAK